MKLRFPILKLESKAFIFTGLTLFLCIGIGYFVVSRIQQEIVLREVKHKARLIADEVIDLRKWQSAMVERLRQRYRLDLLPNPLRRVVESFAGRIMLTHPVSYDSRKVVSSEGAAVPAETSSARWYAWRHITPKNFKMILPSLQPFEKESYSYLYLDPDYPKSELDTGLGSRDTEYWYARRITAKRYCISCHAEWSGKVGKPVGVIAIQMGTSEERAALHFNKMVYLWGALASVVATLGVLHLLVRRLIIRPLGHLNDVSTRIAKGDLTVRAHVRTGDELEHFATVFNRMVEGLEDSQVELHLLNRSLQRNLEELGQANLKLFEMNRLKSQFLANMSHELRTPLNAVIGFSELLDEQSAGPLNEKQLRYVENIHNSGRHLLRLINELLDLARIESGKIEVKLAPTSLRSCIENVVIMRESSLKRGQTLSFEVPPDMPPLFTDEGKVTQIIDNLVGNAIKFTDEGGSVTVKASLDGDFAAVEVSDTGIGIAPEFHEVIFDKFRQVDSSSTRRHMGAGLGLAIVKEMCTLLGGTVSVKSAPGQGTTFIVRLPLQSPEPAPGGLGSEIG